jgi:hypothetical protein
MTDAAGQNSHCPIRAGSTFPPHTGTMILVPA